MSEPTDFGKRWIVDQARAFLKLNWSVEDLSSACLYHTVSILKIAGAAGIELVPQAGTAHWRSVSEEEDDGVSPTHFGYEWSPAHPLSAMMQAIGGMPEMHVWAANPKTNEIVDLTVGYQVERSERTGAIWSAERLPPFFWTPVEALPPGTVYIPSREATELAVEMMIDVLRKRVQ